MGNVAGERGESTPPLLDQAELISRERRFSQILGPREIPVHPLVYGVDFAYTRDFFERVHATIPTAVRSDLEAIRRVLGVDLPIEVTDTRIGDHFELDGVDFYGSRRRRSFSLQYSHTSLGLGPVEGYAPTVLRPDPSNPMPKRKLLAYALFPEDSNIETHTWDTNNYHLQGLPGELYFRSFAIMFNNMALGELGK